MKKLQLPSFPLLSLALATALLLAGCSQTAPPNPLLKSQAQAAATGVAFEPPITTHPFYSGTFDPGADLHIVVFPLSDGSEADTPVGPTYSTEDGSIRVQDSFYLLPWRPADLQLPGGASIRVEVRLGGAPDGAPACASGAPDPATGCLAYFDATLHPDLGRVSVTHTATPAGTSNATRTLRLNAHQTLPIKLFVAADAANVPPTVTDLTVSPDPVAPHATATFTWTANDPDGDALTCSLDANGDGTPDVGPAACTGSATYSYAAAGSYTATLTVDDGHGHSATASTNETVGAQNGLLWTTMLGGEWQDHGYAVATDSAGNAYLTGNTNSDLPGQANTGGSTATTDAYVARFDGAGQRTWLREFGTAADDAATALAADGAGDVYVVGNTTGAFPGFTNPGYHDIFLAKYDAGGTRLWVYQFGTNGDDLAGGVAVAADGSVYLSGKTTNALPGQASYGQADAVLVKFDPNGTPVWFHQFGTSNDEYASHVAIAPDGTIVLDGVTDGGFAGHANAGSYDAFVAAFDSSGNQLWSTEFGSPAYDLVFGIGIDGAGNVYVPGSTEGSMPGQTGTGSTDAYLAKIRAGGGVLWIRQLGNASNTDGAGVAVDAAGNGYLVGSTLGALPGATASYGVDAYLAKYGPGGDLLWIRQFGTPQYSGSNTDSGNDWARSVALGPDGAVLVGGDTTGAFPGEQSAGGLYDAFVAKFAP